MVTATRQEILKVTLPIRKWLLTSSEDSFLEFLSAGKPLFIPKKHYKDAVRSTKRILASLLPHTMSSPPSVLHLKPSETTSPRVKPFPKSKTLSVPFSYAPSDDGTDENLLILLHGLGEHLHDTP